MQETDTYNLNTTYGNENYVIKFWYNNNSVSDSIEMINMIGNAIKEKSAAALSKDLYPKIYDSNNNLVGEFEGRTNGSDFKNSYNYVHGNILGQEFDVYQIGHQGKDTVYYIYDNNQILVGAITDTVKLSSGNKGGINNMTIYSNDTNWFKIISLYTVVLSIMLEKKLESNDYNANINTFQPDLLAKENYQFINNIELNTNPMFLPMNMPLVNQYASISKNDVQNKLPFVISFVIIGSVVLIIILFLIFAH